MSAKSPRATFGHCMVVDRGSCRLSVCGRLADEEAREQRVWSLAEDALQEHLDSSEARGQQHWDWEIFRCQPLPRMCGLFGVF